MRGFGRGRWSGLSDGRVWAGGELGSELEVRACGPRTAGGGCPHVISFYVILPY